MNESNKKLSAGLLMYRELHGYPEIFLAHPGGPFWSNRDEWGIPKGKAEPNESIIETAIREFKEETGITPSEPFIPIGIVQSRKKRKNVHAWAFKWNSSLEPKIVSNYTSMEYPSGSGKIIEFPEMDKARFFTIEEARKVIHPYQDGLITNFLMAKKILNPLVVSMSISGRQ